MVMRRVSPFDTGNDGLVDAPNLVTVWTRAQTVFLMVIWFGIHLLTLIPVSLVFLLQAINNFKHGSPMGGIVYLLVIPVYPLVLSLIVAFHAIFYYNCVS
jgi:hypothetical protein